jgi:hypothetical protein
VLKHGFDRRLDLGGILANAPFRGETPDAVGIIGLIGQQYRSRTNMVQQAVSSLAVMALPSGQAQSDRDSDPSIDRWILV